MKFPITMKTHLICPSLDEEDPPLMDQWDEEVFQTPEEILEYLIDTLQDHTIVIDADGVREEYYGPKESE